MRDQNKNFKFEKKLEAGRFKFLNHFLLERHDAGHTTTATGKQISHAGHAMSEVCVNHSQL